MHRQSRLSLLQLQDQMLALVSRRMFQKRGCLQKNRMGISAYLQREPRSTPLDLQVLTTYVANQLRSLQVLLSFFQGIYEAKVFSFLTFLPFAFCSFVFPAFPVIFLCRKDSFWMSVLLIFLFCKLRFLPYSTFNFADEA